MAHCSKKNFSQQRVVDSPAGKFMINNNENLTEVSAAKEHSGKHFNFE